MKRIKYCSLFAVCLLAGCTASIPDKFTAVEEKPAISPDYTNLTIPPNIAPMHFAYLETDAKDAITVYSCDSETMIVRGLKPRLNIKKWHHLLTQAKGKSIKVTSYIKKDKWYRHKEYTLSVAEEPVDPYISYRLIAPSYVTYEDLTINQRCLENFDEKVIYCNMLIGTEQNGQCINCHSCRNNNPDSLQFHARQYKGGTVMAFDGDVRKINLKTDSTLSAGVYPAWHPTHHYIAYSVNNTGQSFHTLNNEKIEVQDIASDLILYDIDKNEVTTVENDSLEWECFPCWTPDGRYLYYVSAHFEVQDHSMREREIIDRYQEFKYNLYRKPFDPETKHFGPKELVYDAASVNKSITLPRVSPDGRFLLAAIGDYGVFHIWHKSADLMLFNLEDGNYRLMREANSTDTESFHNFSTNGRWVIFSSRRDDGSFTRLYLTYFDKRGRARKPFVIPQKDPDHYLNFYRSYNIPEFMTGPVTVSPHEFAKRLSSDATNAVYHEAY